MNILLFLILLCKSVIASDEEINEKYIDLLPEEEKQEFLNRIARRILEEIQNNDTPKESYVDITDDQLDAHDAFVKEIIKEESDNLKKEKRRSENKELNETDQAETNNDNLNENNDAGEESNPGNKEEHIDLTLREGKRLKRTNGNNGLQKETTTEMSYDVIPVKTVYDQFENDDVKVDNKPMFLSLKENSTLDVEREGNLKNEERLAVVSNLQNSNNLILSNNINDTWGTTQKIYDNESEGKEEDHEKVITKAYSRTSNDIIGKMKETTTTSPADVTEPSKNESTNIAISPVPYSNLHKSKSKFVRRMTDSFEHEDAKTETVISKTYPTVETTSESLSLSTIDNTPPRKPVSEVVNDTINESKDMEILGINKRAPTKNEYNMTLGNPEVVENGDIEILFVTESINISTSKDTLNVKTVEHNTEIANSSEKQHSNMLNNNTVLRARPDNLYEVQIDENESKQNIDDDPNKVKVYEVFEIDPNQPHFMATGKHLQNEHPLYASVYNYAPENAYFRPYNKFGPNIEDFEKKYTPESNKGEDSKQFNVIDSRNPLSGYNQDKNRGSSDKNIRNTKQSSKKQKPKQYHGFMKPLTKHLLNQEINYNPDDYADYYFGRILRTGKHRNNNANNKTYFGHSSEEKHPMSSIHKSDSIKDYVKAVRNISHLQNLFGFVPQVSERSVRKANEFFRKHKTPKKSKKYKVSMNYYFDRDDPVKKELFRSNKSKFKPNIYTNIVPLMPNPLYYDLENIPEKQDLEIDKYSESMNQEISDLSFKKLFDSMIVVLKDLIQVKNEKLVNYNWLKTTVNIQAALRKLMDLIQQINDGERVHPKDIELLKYTIYLFKSSKRALEEESINKNSNRIKDSVKRKKSVMKFPKTKIKIKTKEPIKLWKNVATFLRSEEDEEEIEGRNNNLLKDFEDLLQNLLFILNDLHDAIKHISITTEYKNQNWLQDLNLIFLKRGNKKNLAKIILHLSLSRLLDSIEDSFSSVENNFRDFVNKNREIVKKSKEECLFVLNVLEELRRLNE